MRTNIELDDNLMEEAQRYSSARTKRALVEEALETFVKVKERERRRQDYAERLREVRRKTSSLKLRSSALDIINSDRNRS